MMHWVEGREKDGVLAETLAGTLAEIGEPFASGWRRRGIEGLLPMQRRAIRESVRGDGANVLVLAPSSSGKTLVGEVAIARALKGGRAAVYLVPTKALAEEKFTAFSDWLDGSGYRVLCATSDRPDTDAAAMGGRFDVLVAVYEKLHHFVLVAPQMMARVGAVVVDEVQMLEDPDRGATLDVLLTKIKGSPYRAQIVALGPPFSDPGPVAEWLGCRLVVDRSRPRELHEGVLDIASGVFRYRTVNSEEEGSDALAEEGALEEKIATFASDAIERGSSLDPEEAGLLAVAAHLSNGGGQTLFFAPTRYYSRKWAHTLAGSELGFPAAGVALAELLRYGEGGAQSARLAACLEAGIGFHNSDLDPYLRALVEGAFQRREIRILVSTATLGIGVNLTADSVVHTNWRIEQVADGGGGGGEGIGEISGSRAVVRAELSRRMFSNQGGRAARLGLGQGAGRSILVAHGGHHAERIWEQIISEPEEPLAERPFSNESLSHAVLAFLSGANRRTTENIVAAIGETYAARTTSRHGEAFEARIAEAIERCECEELLRRSRDGSWWELSGLGEICAAQGIAIATLGMLRRLCEESNFCVEGRIENRAFEWLIALGECEEGMEALAPLGLARRRPPLPVPECMESCIVSDGRGEDAFAPSLGRGGPSRSEVAAWMGAAAMTDWLDGIAGEAIEKKYGLTLGALASVADRFAWLVGALGSVWANLGGTEVDRQAIGTLAERVRWGVREEGLALARLRVRGLGREAIHALVRQGYDTPAAICQVGRAALTEWVGQDVAAELEAAAKKAKSAKSEERSTPRERKTLGPQNNGITTSPVRVGAQPGEARRKGSPQDRRVEAAPVVQIDMESPGVILARGTEVLLPPLPFLMLAALAERRGQVVSREALYQRLWPGGGPEDQQLDNHRRTLLGRLRPVLRDHAGEVAEVVRGAGFRMVLAAEDVCLRSSTGTMEPASTISR